MFFYVFVTLYLISAGQRAQYLFIYFVCAAVSIYEYITARTHHHSRLLSHTFFAASSRFLPPQGDLDASHRLDL